MYKPQVSNAEVTVRLRSPSVTLSLTRPPRAYQTNQIIKRLIKKKNKFRHNSPPIFARELRFDSWRSLRCCCWFLSDSFSFSPVLSSIAFRSLLNIPFVLFDFPVVFSEKIWMLVTSLLMKNVNQYRILNHCKVGHKCLLILQHRWVTSSSHICDWYRAVLRMITGKSIIGIFWIWHVKDFLSC